MNILSLRAEADADFGGALRTILADIANTIHEADTLLQSFGSEVSLKVSVSSSLMSMQEL